MRGIKFRLIKDGKIVGYEKWYPGEKHSPDSGMEGWAAEPRWLYSYNNIAWGTIYISCDTKDWFAGKTDKNGVEICEGDEVDTSCGIGIVEYNSYLAGFQAWPENRKTGCLLITDEDIEVIGSIHEEKP